MFTLTLCFLGLSHIASVRSVDTAYFIAVNVSQYQNKDATIICPENKTCDISCAPSSSCATLNVDARNAINLNIACDGSSSCTSINVTGPNIANAPAANITISCNGAQSCYNAKYRLSNTHNADINCMNDRACYYADFYLYNTSMISTICHNAAGSSSGTYGACRSTEFFADDSTSFSSECYENDCNSARFYVRNGQNATINLIEGSTGKDATIYAAELDGTLDIHCSAYMTCWRFAIEAESMKGDLNVYCTGAESSMCNGIEVYAADMTGDLYFACDSDVAQGCASANIYCPHTETAKCTVYCSGRQGNECQNADIYVMSPQYVNSGSLDLTCEGSGSCFYLDIICYDSFNTKTVYNYHDNTWSCDDYQCGCPWINNANDNILCDTFVGADCDINCANIANGGCEGIVINASLSTNLYLNCEPNSTFYHHGCEGSTIICPQDVDNAICSITCVDNGCESTTIIAPNGNDATLSVECQDTASCEYATIQSEGINLDFRLQCNGLSTCRYMQVNISSADTANITCSEENSCWDLEMNIFSGPNMMHFQCGSFVDNKTYSCRDSIIKAVNVPINSTWNQYCLNKASCWGMYLDVISPITSNLDLSLHCIGAESCYSVIFAAPNGNHASVYCTNIYSCGQGTASTYRLGWDFSNFSSVDIICNSSNATDKNEAACGANMVLTNVDTVDLYCNEFDCAQHTFTMSNAGNITINCDGERSCYFSKFFASSSDSLDISCSGQQACRAVDISCPFAAKDACQLTCSDDYYSCYWMDINVDDDYTYNYLDLQCLGTDSCRDLNFRCSGPKLDTLYTYNSAVSVWECATDTCCPFKDELVGLCEDDADCTILCASGETECADTIIDATNAASLYIYCEDCASSVIYCPLLNGNCAIECVLERSCDNTNIYYFNDDVPYSDHYISLNCSTNVTDACYYTTVYAYNGGHVYFTSVSSSYVTLYGSNAISMDIQCIGSNALTAYGESVSEEVNVYCTGPEGCVSSNFHFQTANNVNVVVSGFKGLYYSNIYASNASSLSVSCSYDQLLGCANAYIYYPNTNGSLHCYGKGCHSLTLYSIHNMRDISFSLNTCNECQSVGDCVNGVWQLKCGYDAFTDYVAYYGGYCSNPDTSGCECGYVLDTLNHTMYAAEEDNCYSWIIPTTEIPTTTEELTTTGLLTTSTAESVSTEADIIVSTEGNIVTTRGTTSTTPHGDSKAASFTLMFSVIVSCFGLFV